MCNSKIFVQKMILFGNFFVRNKKLVRENVFGKKTAIDNRKYNNTPKSRFLL